MENFLDKIKEFAGSVSLSPLSVQVSQEKIEELLRKGSEKVPDLKDIAIDIRDGEAKVILYVHHKISAKVTLHLLPGEIFLNEDTLIVRFIQKVPPEIEGSGSGSTFLLRTVERLFRDSIYDTISRKTDLLQIDAEQITVRVPLQRFASESVLKILHWIDLEKYTFEEQKVRVFIKFRPLS